MTPAKAAPSRRFYAAKPTVYFTESDARSWNRRATPRKPKAAGNVGEGR